MQQKGRSLVLSCIGPRPSEELRAQVQHALRLALVRLAERDELQRTRERMELLSVASFEGLFFHVDGVIIDANQRLADMLGYAPEEVLGAHTLQRCVAPEDLPAVLERMAARHEGAYVIDGVRKDGSRFRAEIAPRIADFILSNNGSTARSGKRPAAANANVPAKSNGATHGATA